MAFHISDNAGNAIKSDILVFGYIKPEIKQENVQIPTEMEHLYFVY